MQRRYKGNGYEGIYSLLYGGNGATSPIDVVYAPVDYTAEEYIADCENNANEDWNKMLNEGTVGLQEVE